MTHKEKLDAEKLQRLNDWLNIFAEAVHFGWKKGMIRKGYVYGPERDDEKLTHPHVLDWKDMAEGDKESSYWAAEGVLTSLIGARVMTVDYHLR